MFKITRWDRARAPVSPRQPPNKFIFPTDTELSRLFVDNSAGNVERLY